MSALQRSLARRRASRHMNTGIRLARAGRLTEAIEQFSQALEHNPEDGTIRYNLGLAYTRCDRQKEALSEFRLATRFEPMFADGYFALATAYKSRRAEVPAHACYAAYLDLEPRGKLNRVARTRINEIRDRLDASSWNTWLEATRADWVEERNAYLMLGVDIAEKTARERRMSSRELLGVAEEQIMWLWQDHERSINQWAAAHLLAAATLFERRKYNAAIAQTIEAVHCNPCSQTLLISLAATCGQAGQHAAAVRIAQSIEREKLDPDELIALGDVLGALRDGGHLS